ncbi:hypothetical protein LR948_16210, partial [Roseivivax sp. GX 12232]|uniref:calcium-binding protein n=1 Tax=Roseivivax sp. GX 12232 TaxID=2900547 RepID=UPI00351D35A6|nr:hypothetical protein [Roseivivax sp. GX 12232]
MAAHELVVNVDSISDFHGSSFDEIFVLGIISSGYPQAVLDGSDGLDTLDARNVFVGSDALNFRDALIGDINGFSVGDFGALNFEQIFGSFENNNSFLLQNIDYALKVHGGSGDDWFATSIGPSDAFTADALHGYGGNDYFYVRPLDQAFGGDDNDIFDLYASAGDLTGSLVDGGDGVDGLELGFGWTVDLSVGYAEAPFSGALDRYTLISIENVEVDAWRGYLSRVTGSAESNVLSVDLDFNDGSVGVVFEGLAGEDLLLGSNGEDTLLGGGNDDTLVGRSGADILEGGDGVDAASFAGSFSRVDVRLALSNYAHGGDATGDRLNGIE